MEVHFVIFRSDANFATMEVHAWCNFYVWYTTSFTTMEVHVTAQCVDGSALFDPDRFTGGQWVQFYLAVFLKLPLLVLPLGRKEAH